MAKIHYFQRYSSAENTVTNNTLQLFTRIYADSSVKAAQFINELTDIEIEIGPRIEQQVREGSSVPDAMITQASFKIIIESKVSAQPNLQQLLEHAKAFKNEENKILLLLTIHKLSKEYFDQFNDKIRSSFPTVFFKNITYEHICRAAESLYQEFELEMRELTNDYKEYCNDTGLFDQSSHYLRIVPCGQSLDINLKHGIYFHPSYRGYTKHAYIGIYKGKTVRAIWQIDSVFDVTLDGDKLNKKCVDGRDTNEYDEKIRSIIKDAFLECSYDIETDHRFFCGKIHLTDYKKISPGGIQGARFINLRDEIGEFSSTEEAAALLRDKTWK